MATVRKNYEPAWVSFKALPDEGGKTGRFEAVVSVFGNVDYQGDRVVKGAFKKSIQKWQKSGDPIPIIWSHDWGDPFAHVGAADPALAEETDVGLKLTGTFDVHKPFAAQVYDLVKDRRVREWSFAYDVEKEDKAKDGANELQVLDLIEAGPTLKGANPDTFTLGVKSALESAAAKAGRMLSAKNETALRTALGKMSEALDEVNAVLSGLDKPELDTGEEKTINITVNGSAVDPDLLAQKVREQLLSLTNRRAGGPVLTDEQKEWLKAEQDIWLKAEQEAWYSAEREFSTKGLAEINRRIDLLLADIA